jgi:hypothetical protein
MIEHNKITTNRDPANGTTVPNVGIAAARPKPRGKRATLAAAVVSAGLTLFGLGLAAGTAHADDPGQAPQAPSPGDPGQAPQAPPPGDPGQAPAPGPAWPWQAPAPGPDGPGQAPQAPPPGDPGQAPAPGPAWPWQAPAPGPDGPRVTCIPWAPGQPCDSYEEKADEAAAAARHQWMVEKTRQEQNQRFFGHR